ncbi:MAG: 4-(cytidine 5'-diphospho)-2-C-methyl-D-erythritol kinase [Sphaerochaetaceae bacterium]|nr:4-(cytidine 5'-diphospho)-2-C-methyl-D-erythritol kinase [Sphaerochaetaceae bacterium]
MELTLKAYPKINIGLYVGSKRPDGYHEISSLFHLVTSMWDTVSVSLEPSSSLCVSVTGLESCVEEKKSTVYKAVLAFMTECNLTASVSVHVEKRLPSQAGLGGGSSDAASTILALNRLTGALLPVSRLSEIGLSVGSDVPFFIYECPLAYVCGRGEHVHPLKAREDLSFSIIMPEGSTVSTALAYRALDERPSIPVLPSMEELYSMYMSPVSAWRFKNDFEIINRRPSGYEPDAPLFLSGSGSAWFFVS